MFLHTEQLAEHISGSSTTSGRKFSLLSALAIQGTKMTHKGCFKSSSFHTRRFTLASVLLWLLGVCARRLSAQGNSVPLRFSPSEIDEIVAAHNELRGRVDPPASNMQALVSSMCLALSKVAKAFFRPRMKHRKDLASYINSGQQAAAS